jgi:hypothetical protein
MFTGGCFLKENGDAPAKVDGIISKPPCSYDLRASLRRFQPIRDGACKLKSLERKRL